ncbi:MAG: MFS transporter [Promethearchaeota archaeon]
MTNIRENGTDDKKSILSWSLYDWANSAFATTIMAGFFPSFFNSYWFTGSGTDATFYLGWANSIASLIVAAMAPFLGAIADRMAGKKKFLFFFAFLGMVMTGSLWLLAAGEWVVAILFYILGTIGFSGGNIFYDSLLPAVASEEKRDYVSSLGFALGYIGGGLLFTLNVLWYLMPSTFGFADEIQAVQVSFLSVAIWWAAFSVPIVLFVKEPVPDDRVGFREAISAGWYQLKDTFSDIKKLKWVGLFLLGYWFYIDGVDTIIRMAVDYGTTLGFETSDLITALLITQFVAFPGTLLFFKFADKIGTRNGVLVAIVAYMCITVVGFFMTSVVHFYLLAMAVGLFQGGIQALSRSLYSRIIPEDKASQFYGFFNMLGKFAAVIGPALMGTVTLLTQNVRFGILAIIVLFIAGGLIFSRVDFEEGERMAREFLSGASGDAEDGAAEPAQLGEATGPSDPHH